MCAEPEGETWDEYMTAKWGEPEWADTDEDAQPWQD